MREIRLDDKEGLKILRFLERHFEEMEWRRQDFDVPEFVAGYQDKQFTFRERRIGRAPPEFYHYITIANRDIQLTWHGYDIHNCRLRMLYRKITTAVNKGTSLGQRKCKEVSLAKAKEILLKQLE